MPLPTALRPLRHRDFALLALASAVSNIGSWMQTVAVGALVADATGQARWVALVAAAQFLPIGLLSPVGGAMADRFNRKRFLIGGLLVVTAVVSVLAVLSSLGRTSPGVVVGLVFLTGATTAMMIPFQQAILPELVPREDLVAAVSIGAAEYNFGRVLGPTIAGVVIHYTSFTWVFVINAVSYLAIVGAIAVARLGPPPAATGESLVRSIRAGARAARAAAGCWSAIVFISLTALMVSPFIALIAAVAETLTGGGKAAVASATGALTTAQGVGAVTGAFLLAPLIARLGHRRAFMANVAGVAGGLTIYAVAGSVPVAVGALVVVGLFYIGILNGLAAVVQLQAPEQFRGRILSLFFVALGIVYPLGALIQGVLGDLVGLRLTMIGGAVLMLVVVVGTQLLAPHMLHALDGDPDGDPVAPADGDEATSRGTPTVHGIVPGEVAGATLFESDQPAL